MIRWRWIVCGLMLCLQGAALLPDTGLLSVAMGQQPPSLREREEHAMKAAVARVAPSVVRIETVGGLERVGELLVGTGPTTGLIVSSDGLIVSSAFNFVQKPDSILVTLSQGTRHAARLVARDHSRLLVVLKIDADEPLPVPQAAPESEWRVGQWALAIGRTFESDQPNVSVGIVSALGRIWGKAIQTDAKISPNNYGGPLIDIAGRVLGVLVPMSPQGTGEVAGVEWYDSGIGFAVPLETVLRKLPTLADGHDAYQGLLGVAMKGDDIYSQPATIAVARPTGPAYKAGLRAGDTIIEIGGRAVAQQAELKHQLGPRYAGETVRLIALRGEERLERDVQLIDKIEPYEAPFLGVLPLRGTAEPGAVVRWVFPDSPAAAAGLKAGDRITGWNGQAIANTSAARERLQAQAPAEPVALEVRRGAETLKLEATLGRLPETKPVELPPAHEELAPPAAPDAAAPAAARPATGDVTIKLPEFANGCTAYVSPSYDPRLEYGVVIWLAAPGDAKNEALLTQWKSLCDRHALILLVPQPAEATQWQPTEVRFVRRALEDILKNYHTDPTRIVVVGAGGGGAMAYLVGLSQADVVRGIGAIESPLPQSIRVPEIEPTHPVAVFTTIGVQNENAPLVQAGIQKLRAAKVPVVARELTPMADDPTPAVLNEMALWIDSLDRL